MNPPLKFETSAELKILHVTDTHLLDSADDTLYGVNTRHSLQKVITRALEKFPETDLLLFTGDISQTGSESSYQIFQSIINNVEKPILCVPGNHDNPELLQQVIPSSPNESIVFIKQKNFSIVLMNSRVEKAHHGALGKDYLDHLQQFLQQSDSSFHIFAIHHVPVPIDSKWLDELGLKNGPRLINMIRCSDIPSLLLCGHIHQPLDLQLAQLRLLATPSTCHQFKAKSDSIQYLTPSLPSFRFIKISLPNQIETSIHFVDYKVRRGKPTNRRNPLTETPT